MFTALGSARDAKLAEAAFELLLDPAVDIRESAWMLLYPATDTTREVARRFVRVNEKAILARMPKEVVTGAAHLLVGVFTNACNAATREETAKYVTDHYGSLGGAKRIIEQKLEELDQCIAKRKLVETELRGFLSGVKLAKAPKP
jgi:hypothetical protein